MAWTTWFQPQLLSGHTPCMTHRHAVTPQASCCAWLLSHRIRALTVNHSMACTSPWFQLTARQRAPHMHTARLHHPQSAYRHWSHLQFGLEGQGCSQPSQTHLCVDTRFSLCGANTWERNGTCAHLLPAAAEDIPATPGPPRHLLHLLCNISHFNWSAD